MSEKRKYALTDVAYLMPPNQRYLARFMNMFDWVKWSKKMLSYEQILTICKSNGLSNGTAIKSNDIVVRNLMIGGLRMQK